MSKKKARAMSAEDALKRYSLPLAMLVAQQTQEVLCVLIGPWKKKRPGPQTPAGTLIFTTILCPGARTEPAGLKLMPERFVVANQCRLLCALAIELTTTSQR